MTEQSSAAARLIRDKVSEAERRENEEDAGSDVFDEDMDPLAMLHALEANRATTSSAQGHVAAYRVVRQQQQKVRRRRTHGSDSPTPDTADRGRGRGRRGGRGRGRTQPQQLQVSASTSASSSSDEAAEEDAWTSEDDPMDDAWDDIVNMPGIPNAIKKKARQRQRRKQARARAALGGQQLMPAEASELLGQANVNYIMQRYDEAIAQLMKVITLAPNIPGPYNTMGAIYEHQGKKDKALDCYMIAAHLNKLDAPAWRRMAELSKDLGLTEQAVYCLTKVIRADKDALDARLERASLYAQLGNLREAVKHLEKLLQLVPDDSEALMLLADAYEKLGEPHRAAARLQQQVSTMLLQRGSAQSDPSLLLTRLLQLLEAAGDAQGTLSLVDDIAQRMGGMQHVPLHARVAAAGAHLQLNQVTAAQPHLNALKSVPATELPDLYIAAAGYLAAASDMQGALSLYSPVVQALEQHALPPHAVSGANLLAAAETAGSAGDVATSGRWLMIALELSDAEGDMQMQCLVQLALLRLQLQGPSVQGAPQLHLRPPEENSLLTLELWEKVVDLLEPWQEATLIIEFSLVVIGTAHQMFAMRMLEQVVCGTIEYYRALAAADGDDQTHADKLQAALERRQGLSYLANAQVGSELSNNEWFTEVVAQLRARRGPRARTAESDDPALMIVMFQDIQHSEAEFRLLWTFMRMLVMEGRVDEAVEMLQETIDMLATRFSDKALKDRLKFLLSEALLLSGNHEEAMEQLKTCCARWPHSAAVYNAWSKAAHRVVACGGKAKALGVDKGIESVPQLLMQVYTLRNDPFKAQHAALHAYRLIPEEPLATTGNVADRNEEVLKGLGLLRQYSALRGLEQESLYNMARAHQMFGLNQRAMALYEELDEDVDDMELRREAAHNLALLYKLSGNEHKARAVLREHCSV